MSSLTECFLSRCHDPRLENSHLCFYHSQYTVCWCGQKVGFNIPDTPGRPFTIYALELEGGHYYIGLVYGSNVWRRFNKHVRGGQAYWTDTYKPLRIIETRYLAQVSRCHAGRWEGKTALEYTERFGLELVRGGPILSSIEKTALNQLIGARTRYASWDGRSHERH